MKRGLRCLLVHLREVLAEGFRVANTLCGLELRGSEWTVGSAGKSLELEGQQHYLLAAQ